MPIAEAKYLLEISWKVFAAMFDDCMCIGELVLIAQSSGEPLVR